MFEHPIHKLYKGNNQNSFLSPGAGKQHNKRAGALRTTAARRLGASPRVGEYITLMRPSVIYLPERGVQR